MSKRFFEDAESDDTEYNERRYILLQCVLTDMQQQMFSTEGEVRFGPFLVDDFDQVNEIMYDLFCTRTARAVQEGESQFCMFITSEEFKRYLKRARTRIGTMQTRRRRVTETRLERHFTMVDGETSAPKVQVILRKFDSPVTYPAADAYGPGSDAGQGSMQ